MTNRNRAGQKAPIWSKSQLLRMGMTLSASYGLGVAPRGQRPDIDHWTTEDWISLSQNLSDGHLGG